MDQSYIRDQNITVEELVKQSVATLGENIKSVALFDSCVELKNRKVTLPRLLG